MDPFMERKSLLPKRIFGNTGEEISILGLGGEGLLRSFDRGKEAVPLIQRALDLGITYFESARAYGGSEAYYGSALKERRKEVFLASKSQDRTRDGALRHLEETLKKMRTEYLDLWLIHDVRTTRDIDLIFGPNGAIKAFEGARQNRLVRFIGVSGHRNPAILSRVLQLFPFDVVLMPVNPAEPHYWSFFTDVMRVANEKGMGILGMKTLSRGVCVKLFGEDGVESFLRFALSQPITAAVVGCDTIEQLEMNARIARTFEPMSERDQEILTKKVASYARELMYYKL
jgi:predicted aldo/keto reductase-like oxidoreductase